MTEYRRRVSQRPRIVTWHSRGTPGRWYNNFDTFWRMKHTYFILVLTGSGYLGYVDSSQGNLTSISVGYMSPNPSIINLHITSY